jgi:TPP-dependent trihydroxycyclohexane-1,2-dione (THcHDO) dehydratase
MRKFSLLVGTLGGAMAGYLFSNAELREQLANAKDAEAAGKILAKHLQKDGKQLGTHVKKFVESDDVRNNMKKAKDYAKKQMTALETKMKDMVKGGAKFTQKSVGGTVKKAATKTKKAAEKVEKEAA